MLAKRMQWQEMVCEAKRLVVGRMWEVCQSNYRKLTACAISSQEGYRLLQASAMLEWCVFSSHSDLNAAPSWLIVSSKKHSTRFLDCCVHVFSRFCPLGVHQSAIAKQSPIARVF